VLQRFQITTALSVRFIQQSVQLERMFKTNKHALRVLQENIVGQTVLTQMTVHKVIALIQRDIFADQAVSPQGL